MMFFIVVLALRFVIKLRFPNDVPISKDQRSFVGGIKNFAHQDATYEKWVLNRPFQARMVDKLQSLAQIDSVDSNPRKCLREKEMVKSEGPVRRIAIVLKDDFLDPFSGAIDQSRLFNLASGRPLLLEISSEVLTTESRQSHVFGV